MSEITEAFAKKQFYRFSKEYNQLRNTDLAWYDFDKRRDKWWDFRAKDKKTGIILPIQYIQAKTNLKQMDKLEAHARGEYSFKFNPRVRKATKSIEEAYLRKMIAADRNTLLLVGFHHYPYERRRKFDSIQDIRKNMVKKFKYCAYKELWIVNVADFDGICDFVF